MKRSRSRWAGVVAVGAVGALLLGACGDDGGNGEPGGDDGKVQLTVAYWGDFGFGTLKKKYEAENPNVELVLNEGDYNAQHENLQRTIIANSGAPDVAAIDEGFIVSFRAQADKFENLLDYGAGQYEDRYLGWKWNQSLSGDGSVQIGLGTDIGGLAMCYRHDLFEEAGLPTDRDEVSQLWPDWDGFISVGEQYVAATGKKFIDNATNFFNPIIGQQSQGFFTNDDELVTDGGPRVAWDQTMDIIEAGLSANIPIWSPEWNAGFSSGEFAVLPCPAWMQGHIQNEAPDTAGKWDIADIPGGGGNWGGSFWTIPAQGSNKEEAYKLVEWLIQPEQQIEIFQEVGNLPSQPALYDDPGIQDRTSEFFNNAPVGQIFSKTAADLQPQFLGTKNGVVRQAVENVINEVQEGAFDRESGWAEAVSRAQREAEI